MPEKVGVYSRVWVRAMGTCYDGGPERPAQEDRRSVPTR